MKKNSAQLTLEDITHIYAIEHDIIVSKKGDLSLIFSVQLPEIFRLSGDDYDLLNATFSRAIANLPEGYIFQRTDICYPVETKYEADSDSYLDKRNANAFGIRKKVEVETFFTFTRVARVEKKTHFNSFFNKRSAVFSKPQYDQKSLAEFLNEVDKFRSTVTSCFSDPYKNLQAIKLTGEESFQLIFNRFYTANLSHKGMNNSADFDNEEHGRLFIGDSEVSILSMNRDGYSPIVSSTAVDGETEIQTVATLHISLLNKLAYALDFPHVIHQSYHTLNHKSALNQLETKARIFKSLVGSSINDKHYVSITEFIGLLRENTQHRLCDHHFGVAVISPSHDRREHQNYINQTSRLLDDLDIKYNKSNFGALNLYLGYCPSNANDIAEEERGRIVPEWGLCFNLFEQTQETSMGGLLFAERRFNTPVVLDMWNYPGISNKNMLIVAPSGTGKSVLVNHMLSHFLFQNYTAVIVDKGGSYKKQALLHEDQKALKSTYVEATPQNPLLFNPFLIVPQIDGKYSLNDNKEGDQDYVTVIVAVIFQAWRTNSEKKMTSEENAVLIEFVKAYFLTYLNRNIEVIPCFTSFYHFSIKYFREKYSKLEHRTFDIASYELVLKMFVESDNEEENGQYSYLFNCYPNPNYYQERFIVFELEYISMDPVLYPITVLIIMNIVLQKLIYQKGRAQRFSFILDEVWSVLSGGMGEFIKYMFKTCRKYGGSIGIATQDMADITNSPFGDAILAQSDTKIFMQPDSASRGNLARVLALTDHQENLLNSIKKAKYEIFFKFLDRAVVYRLHLSDQAIATYMSDQEHNKTFLTDAKASGSIEKAINNFVERKRIKSLPIIK